jgi:hypothetical protein
MKKYAKSDKKVSTARRTMKKQSKKTKKSRLVTEYRTVFSPLPLPFGEHYTDEDSLEQPSALRYVPSTTRPTVEMAIDPQMRRDAKLA